MLIEKYLKSSPIEKNIKEKEIGLELKTNFEALQEGTFPEQLLEENFVIKPKIFKNIVMIFLFEYQYNYPALNKKGYAPGI